MEFPKHLIDECLEVLKSCTAVGFCWAIGMKYDEFKLTVVARWLVLASSSRELVETRPRKRRTRRSRWHFAKVTQLWISLFFKG